MCNVALEVEIPVLPFRMECGLNWHHPAQAPGFILLSIAVYYMANGSFSGRILLLFSHFLVSSFSACFGGCLST